MKFIKKVSNALHSRVGAYIFFLLSVFAFINLKGATWAYGWIDTFSGVIISSVVIGCSVMPNVQFGNSDSENMPELTMQSVNAAEGATVIFESLKKDETPDAVNMLSDDNSCWTAQAPAGMPAEGFPDANNSYAEIQLAQKS